MAENLNARRGEKKKVRKFKVMVTKATMILPDLPSSSTVCFSVLLSSDVLIYTCSVAELLWELNLWGFLDANPLQTTRDDGGFCFCFNIHFFVMVVKQESLKTNNGKLENILKL